MSLDPAFNIKRNYSPIGKTLVPLLFLFVFSNLSAQSKDLVFIHATLIDGTGAAPKPDMTVVIRGNQIAAIRQTNLDDSGNGQVIDASGKFLIPGLWDAHVHLFNHITIAPPNEYYFPLFIANGVTSVRDLWVKFEEIKQVQDWRNAVERNELAAPRIVAVGTMVDGENPIWENADTVADAEEARQMVVKLKAAGMDFVKVYWNLTREEYFAIADEAKKQKIPFEGHVPFAVRADEASDAGQATIEHLTEIPMTCSNNEKNLRAVDPEVWDVGYDQKLVDSYDSKKCSEVYSHFVKNGTWQCPTLVMYYKLASNETEMLNDQRMKYIPADERKRWELFIENLRKRSREKIEYGRNQWKLDLKLVREMHDAGVNFMAGTDVSIDNSFIYAGFSLHDELSHLVEAGFSPMEALQSATVNPAKFMGKLNVLGTLEEGKIADMVLLDANPLEDIHNTRKIHAVILNGKIFEKEALQKMLTDAEISARKK
jgi:imidazolonepropionase-like amidohydrolase